MKRLIFLLLASGALAVGSSGCGDDDDDGSASAGSGGGAGADGGEAGADGGEAGAAGGAPVVYECGGDEAECDLLDANACDDGYGCQFLLPSSGSGAPYAQCTESGAGDDGDACDADKPCKPGFDCHDGVCHKYCCEYGSSSQCPTGQACVIAVGDASGGTTDVSLCDACDGCNPLTLDGCAANQGCYPIQPKDAAEDIGCRLCLTSVGEKDAGEACTAVNECKPGLGCYSVEGADPVCVPFCDLEANPDACESGTRCQDSAGSEAMELQIGLCLSN